MNFKLEKNFNNNVPSWEAILNNFNWSFIANKDIKHICPGFFVSHEAHLIKEVQTSLEKLDCKIAHLYFNIAIGKTFGKHKDLLIVKKNVYHEVVPLTPRAGISMSKI